MKKADALKTLRDDSGQTLVLTVMCAGLLMGYMALALDIGLLFNARRRVQIAADAAATAGAQAFLNYGYDTAAPAQTIQQWVAAAVATSAAANGVTASDGGPTVTTHLAPNIQSAYHNSSGNVEVILTEPNPTVFMGTFSRLTGGNNFSTVTVAARAVAGSPSVSQGCVFVLDPSASQAMYLQGSFVLNAEKCGVVVNSTASNALDFTGASGSLTASWVGIAGGAGGHTGDSTPAPVTGVVPVTNPLAAIIPPTPNTGSLPCTAGGTLTGNVGSAGGSVCYSGNVTLSNAVLQGTVVFTGNVTLSNSVTTGTYGATIDLNSGTMTENSGTTINLTAPSDMSDPYHGLVIMAPQANTSTLTFEFGNTTGTLSGIIDAPGATLYLHDSGGDHSGGLTLTTDLVVDKLNDQTASLTLYSYSAGNTTVTPLKSVSLVE